MGNSNFYFEYEKFNKRINLCLLETDIHSFDNLFELAAKSMKKVEEVRLGLIYKLMNLCIKTGIIILEQLSFYDIMKSITLLICINKSSISKFNYSFNLNNPYLKVNENETKDLLEIVNCYNYFLEYVYERIDGIEVIEKELTTIFQKIKSKHTDKSLLDRFEKDQK